MRYTVDALALMKKHLDDLPGVFVTVQPPTDLADRLPALVVETSAPTKIANHASPRKGLTCTVAINALAESRAEASRICDEAYGLLWESARVITPYGWVVHVGDVQQPLLVRNQSGVDNIFQFSAAVNVVLRR